METTNHSANMANQGVETLIRDMAAMRVEVAQLRVAVLQQQHFQGHAQPAAKSPQAIGNGCLHELQDLFTRLFDPANSAFGWFRLRSTHNLQCQCWNDLTGMAHRCDIKAEELDRSFQN